MADSTVYHRVRLFHNIGISTEKQNNIQINRTEKNVNGMRLVQPDKIRSTKLN